MSARWDGQELLQPIAPDQPCGESLEDTALLASIEATRLFSQIVPFDAPREQNDQGQWKPPNWSDFRGQTLEALGKSKDLRLLANLGVALLRTDGVAAFCQTLTVASGWLESYWADTYPRLDDGDATLRRNALNCFADTMAVVDGVRRLPLISSRQHGVFNFRDIDAATGPLPPRDGEPPKGDARIDAAFLAMPVEELTALQQSVAGAVTALRQIEGAMLAHAGATAVPSFEALSTPLSRMNRVLQSHLAKRGSTGEDTSEAAAVAAGWAGAETAVGAIRSRQDAVRALDAVAEYFRRNEPSSPIPMFVDRAKRLVSKSFLQVLADVAPEALPHARIVGGVPESEPS